MAHPKTTSDSPSGRPRLGPGTPMRAGADLVVDVAGLRYPSSQIDRFQPPLMPAQAAPPARGGPECMPDTVGIVLNEGEVRTDDRLRLKTSPGKQHLLETL